MHYPRFELIYRKRSFSKTYLLITFQLRMCKQKIELFENVQTKIFRFMPVIWRLWRYHHKGIDPIERGNARGGPPRFGSDFIRYYL